MHRGNVTKPSPLAIPPGRLLAPARGRDGELCGAVSGALMVLGLKNGHYIQGDVKGKEQAYKLAKEFTDRFREQQGNIVCKELLGYDLSNPDDYKLLADKGIFKTECPKFIECAIEVLESMLSL